MMMKLVVIAAVYVYLSLAAIHAAAFVHPSSNQYDWTNKKPTTSSFSLFSTTATPPPPSTNTPTPIMTRFDRLKKSYKGPKKDLDDSEVPFSYEDFGEAVSNTRYDFNRNDVVSGTCVEYNHNGVLVDIGAKANAFLPQQECSLFEQDTTTTSSSSDGMSAIVPLDEPMEFQIISEEDENGQLLVSLKRLQYKAAWETVLRLQESDDTILEAPVIAVNRGGAICLVHGLRAFLPGSHLAGRMPTEDLIGQVLPLKFLEVNQETNKLVVSNRRAVVEQQMSDLSRGDIVQGMVKALKPYGAFVEVGGMSGLLHISQISYDRIENLEKVLQPGMPVKCMIIDHDKVNGRIALSTKTLEPEPGDMMTNPEMVFEKAEETAQKYHERMEAERKAREEAARDIVLGLGDSLDDLTANGENDAVNGGGKEENDPLANVSDDLDSLLS